MKRKGKFQLLISILNISILVIASVTPVFAYVMKSNNYRIQSDSLNVGGARQTSSAYIMEDTIGEIATGPSDSATYKLKAGYQQMQESYVSLASPGNIDMGSISLSQDDVFGTGSAWTVKTDNPAGYILTFKTDRDNCMDGGTNQFTDYTEASTGTPDAWSVDAANYEFGFSVCGADVSNSGKSWGTDSTAADCTCGTTHTPSSDLSWMGFTSTTAITVATSGGRTTTSGTETNICVGAEQGTNVYAPDGSFTADITATVITQ